MVSLIYWCPPCSWIAQLSWYSRWLWLHRIFGALYFCGCSGLMALAPTMAAQIEWCSLVLWLHFYFGTLPRRGSHFLYGTINRVGYTLVMVLAEVMDASDGWYSPSRWLLASDGTLQKGGCSPLLVLSLTSAAQHYWCSRCHWLLIHNGARTNYGCSMLLERSYCLARTTAKVLTSTMAARSAWNYHGRRLLSTIGTLWLLGCADSVMRFAIFGCTL